MSRRLLPPFLAAIFLGLSAWWLAALSGQASVAVPGGGPGDNLTFLWNSWWMYRVVHGGGSFFFSPMLFAPFGVDLTLHTHTALPSLVAAAFASPDSLVLRTNLVIALHLFLNFSCAFALAWRVTRDLPAAVLGGLVFGWSPYVGSHLAGHFNLIAAWILPLTLYVLMASLEDRSRVARVGLGILAGLAPYIDYYYAIYAFVLVIVFVVQRSLTLRMPRGLARSNRQRGLLRVIAGLWLAVLVVVMAIATTGGGVIHVGSRAVSMLSIDNPISILGVLTLAWVAAAVVPRIRATADWPALGADASRLAMPLAIGTVLVAPLLIHAIALWQHGDYVTQKYFWRSAPRGVDLATLVLGNPNGFLWQGVTTRAYARLGIDAVEQVAWLGPGVIGLSVAALAVRNTDHRLRPWLWVLIVFGTWALGPSLVAFGHDTRALLPGVLLRYLPIVSNARIPARAVVIVYLCAAVLCAIGLTELRRRGRFGVAAVLAALVVVDYLPQPVPVYRLDQPRPYQELARRADQGILCELPLGLRDGFGENGRFDSRVLAFQMIHQHAITGGFVARLSPKLLDAYERSPILGVLLRLSAGAPLAGEAALSISEGGAALRAAGIRYVMVNRLTAPADLLAYVRTGLPLRVLSEDDERTLYEVVH